MSDSPDGLTDADVEFPIDGGLIADWLIRRETSPSVIAAFVIATEAFSDDLTYWDVCGLTVFTAAVGAKGLRGKRYDEVALVPEFGAAALEWAKTAHPLLRPLSTDDPIVFDYDPSAREQAQAYLNASGQRYVNRLMEWLRLDLGGARLLELVESPAVVLSPPADVIRNSPDRFSARGERVALLAAWILRFGAELDPGSVLQNVRRAAAKTRTPALRGADILDLLIAATSESIAGGRPAYYVREDGRLSLRRAFVEAVLARDHGLVHAEVHDERGVTRREYAAPLPEMGRSPEPLSPVADAHNAEFWAEVQRVRDELGDDPACRAALDALVNQVGTEAAGAAYGVTRSQVRWALNERVLPRLRRRLRRFADDEAEEA